MTAMEIELGTGDVFWYLFWFALWLAWIAAVVMVFLHMMRSPDLPGWGKAIWAAIILILPLIGVLAYLCVRGAKEDQSVTRYNSGYMPSAGSSVAGPGTGRQVDDLARLRDQGVITQSEFDNLRTRTQA
jgi:hypothetical protein